jgi:hypothetical protein
MGYAHWFTWAVRREPVIFNRAGACKIIPDSGIYWAPRHAALPPEHAHWFAWVFAQGIEAEILVCPEGVHKIGADSPVWPKARCAQKNQTLGLNDYIHPKRSKIF